MKAISLDSTVLVTGGAGFIGSNFIRYLLAHRAQPHIVANLDKLTYAGNRATTADLEADPRHTFFQADIANGRQLKKILANFDNLRAVVHFAAESHVDRSIDSPKAFLNTNILGTFQLLKATRDYWSRLPAERAAAFRFLHVSTDEVYGTLGPDDPAFHETTPYAPNSPYAASKAAGDHLARAWHHTYGLPVLTTNCSNNYGPFQFPEKLIPLVILNALDGKPLPIYGDGKNMRDWLFVEDHCAGILDVLEKGRLGETYNIGGGYEATNLEIVNLICDTLDRLQPRVDGRSYRKQIKFVADRPGHDRRYAIDARKIARELGWRPAETFASGLEKTVRWYLENRAWCERVAADKAARKRRGRPAGGTTNAAAEGMPNDLRTES